MDWWWLYIVNILVCFVLSDMDKDIKMLFMALFTGPIATILTLHEVIKRATLSKDCILKHDYNILGTMSSSKAQRGLVYFLGGLNIRSAQNVKRIHRKQDKTETLIKCSRCNHRRPAKW